MNNKSYQCICFLFLASIFSGCTDVSQGVFVDENRSAIPEPKGEDHFGDWADKIVYADQNWRPAESLWFYNTSQGSNMVPYDIFIHLEQKDSTELFRSDKNMRKYRYLPQAPSWDNEDGLPVGFVRDVYQREAYVGLTCAACHTNQINHEGVGIRIDGAPTLADIESMLNDLEAALPEEEATPEKFRRLEEKVLQSDEAKEKDMDRDDFKSKLQTVKKDLKDYNRRNAPKHNGEDISYGYGRLDAIGRIHNRVLDKLAPGKDNRISANAPVSYPFLWDTPHHDFVQWNGSVDNTGIGPLGRNTGEVLGVFATFDLEKKNDEISYRSSALNRNQIRLERQIRSLVSPLWKDLADKFYLPPIDENEAKLGKKVFEEYKCQLCHRPFENKEGQVVNRKDPDRLVIAELTSLDRIGTDEFMAKNAINNEGNSGFFKGKELEGERKPFGKKISAAKAVKMAIKGALKEPDPDKGFFHGWADKIYDFIVAFFDNPVKNSKKHFNFEIVDKKDPKYFNAYKGRPLNGIWATAPYLHNGSVPNLKQLFLPSECQPDHKPGRDCRSKTFTVGSREFDTEHVGFVSKKKKDYPGLFVFDTSKDSNSNKGHEYATGRTPIITLDENGKPSEEWLGPITEGERVALVEYLKTL